MAKLDGLATVLDFLKGLQPKIAAQIAKKVLSLNVEPRPIDSKELTDYLGYYQVESGECRFKLTMLESAYLTRNSLQIEKAVES